jgi:hypothetical protein
VDRHTDVGKEFALSDQLACYWFPVAAPPRADDGGPGRAPYGIGDHFTERNSILLFNPRPFWPQESPLNTRRVAKIGGLNNPHNWPDNDDVSEVLPYRH